LERTAKVVVVLWACLAVAVESWLLRGGWPGIVPVTLAAFGAAALASAFDRRAVAVVLAFTYVFPALIFLVRGQYHPSYAVVWTGALVGAMVPDGLRRSWQLPVRWRPALVCSALIVVGGAMVVIWREMDFYPGLIVREHAAGPLFMAEWVLHVALAAVTGILWFDWLFGAVGAGVLTMHVTVLTPLAASASVMALVAVYQLLVDVRLLNNTVYGEIARASGTVFDANVCGAIAGLWVGGALLWADGCKRWKKYLMAGGVALAWVAVWATGSRTGFGAAVITSGFAAPALLDRHPERHSDARRKTLLGVLAVAALALGLVLTFANLAAVGPLRRFWTTLPTLSGASIRDFLVENLWTRNGYGTAAVEMIRRFPWFGVGVGSFQTMLPEFARLPPDNAQNWYRHQLAELGLVGSLGWVAWSLSFGRFVLTRRPGMSWTTRIALGTLVAFAAISFVGMPGQEVIVSITFWTFAFLFVSIVGRPPDGRAGARQWGLVAAVVVVFVAGSLRAAQTTLRPPLRAQRLGTPYQYGFHPVEPDGAGGVQRWTRQRAVAVIEPTGDLMELTVSVNHLDIKQRPVDVRVWVNQELAVDTRLVSIEPRRRLIAVPREPPRLFLETWVSRVVKPTDFAGSDARELGLLVSWKFVEARTPAAPTVLREGAR